MHRYAKLAISLVALLSAASAAAQPPVQLPRGIPEGIIPEGADLTEAYVCPDPAELQTKPECCRITVDVDKVGTVTRAEAKCTFAPLEPVMAQCEKARKQEPRITNSGPVPYSKTSYQEHYPAVRSAQEFQAMVGAAEKACDSLR